MSNEFNGGTLKDWIYFSITIALTTVVVVFGYGWINGFNNLGESIEGAGRVLVAAYNGQSGIPSQQVYNYAYPNVRPNISQQVQPSHYNNYLSSNPNNASQAGQYVCPQHGAVGMPIYGQHGNQQCPICGQGMQFHNAHTGMHINRHTGMHTQHWNPINHFNGQP